MVEVNSNESGNEILAFTPARVFFWLIAIFICILVQCFLATGIFYSFNYNTTAGVINLWLSLGEALVVVTLFQIPLFAIVKLISAKAILKINSGRDRKLMAIALSAILSLLSALVSLKLIYGEFNGLGSSWISVIGPIIAALIGIIDAMIYVFLLERIFQSQKVIINDNSD